MWASIPQFKVSERHYQVSNPLAIEIDGCEFMCTTTLKTKAHGSALKQCASMPVIKEEIMKDGAIGKYFELIMKEIQCRTSSSDIVELVETFCRVLNSVDMIRRFIVEHPDTKDTAEAFECFRLAPFLNEWKVSLFTRLRSVQGRKVMMSIAELGRLIEVVKKEVLRSFQGSQQKLARGEGIRIEVERAGYEESVRLLDQCESLVKWKNLELAKPIIGKGQTASLPSFPDNVHTAGSSNYASVEAQSKYLRDQEIVKALQIIEGTNEFEEFYKSYRSLG